MAARSPLLPDVPTVGEAGLAGMEAAVLIGISTTGGTPAALVERLNAVVNEALGDEGVRQKLQELGFIPIGGTAAFYARSLAEETAKWRKVIKESKIPAPA
jgi:tripartite-type tricarboxylate transporter receptor subunit TctC